MRTTKTRRSSTVLYICVEQKTGAKTRTRIGTVDIKKTCTRGCVGNDGEISVETEDGSQNLETRSTVRARGSISYRAKSESAFKARRQVWLEGSRETPMTLHKEHQSPYLGYLRLWGWR